MKSNLTLKITAIILATIVLFSSCASTTMISSVPSGAKVYIDGELMGTTPYKYSDTRIVGTTVNIDLKKEGYQPFYTSFSRTEQVNAGAIVGGLFLLFPFLWTMDYKPTHNYELTPERDIEMIESQAQVTTGDTKTHLKSKSKADQLRDLKQLMDENIITEKEFETAKKKILEDI
jgi:hypothetical protein